MITMPARAAALILLAGAVACGGDRPATPPPPAPGSGAAGGAPATVAGSARFSGPPRTATLAELTPAERQWGIAPRRGPNVTYRPDVVLLENGPQAIRGMGTNGVEWTFDPAFIRDADIAPGKILFATGRVVGRVLDAKKSAAGVVVVLAPVELTEILDEAHLEFSAAVDFSQAIQHDGPELPGTTNEAEPLKVDAPAPMADRRSGPMRALAVGPASMVYRRASDVKAGNFRITPSVGLSGLGAELNHDANGLHFNAEAVLRLTQPTLHLKLDISKGGRLERCILELKGAAGLAMRFNLASSAGAGTNINQTIHVPSDFFIPLLGPEVPFSIVVRQSYLVQTAIGARGRLQGDGEYILEGGFGVGYENGRLGVSGPARFSARHPLIDSVTGISHQVRSGIVLSHQTRVIAGVGYLGFVTGPYFTMTNTMGITRQGDPPPYGVPCKATDTIVFLDAGIGYFMPRALTNGINSFLRLLNLGQIKSEGGIPLLQPEKIVNVHTFFPEVQVCKIF